MKKRGPGWGGVFAVPKETRNSGEDEGTKEKKNQGGEGGENTHIIWDPGVTKEVWGKSRTKTKKKGGKAQGTTGPTEKSLQKTSAQKKKKGGIGKIQKK